MRKSNLNTLLYYAGKNGMDKLYAEFKAGLKSHMRDFSKKYSEDEKVIYYCKEIHKDGIDGPFGITEESFPYSFDDHVKSKINPALNYYLSWIDEIFETESAEKTKAIIKAHKAKIENLFNQINQDSTFPRRGLQIAYKRLIEIDKRYSPDNAIDNVTAKKIYQKYHNLFDGGSGMKAKSAYREIEKWLMEEMELTREDVKERYNVTLELDAFTRSARNNR